MAVRINKKKIGLIMLTSVWVLAGCGTVVLLAAAVKKTDEKQCAGVEINIRGVNNNFFIDKKDVQEIIGRFTGSKLKGKAIQNFDLKSMEKELRKDVWIKNAELYFDNNNVLQTSVEEREPIARIFTAEGNSYYIDTSLAMLPISDKFSARLPVFTGFPSEFRVLSRRDSALMSDIRNISLFIQEDQFLMGIIEQVDITPARTFEMIPKIGNQLILFGGGRSIGQKFSKLKLFYKNIITKTGFGRYNVISLQYENQVVAKVRGKEDVIADSLRTKMLMQMIAETSERLASDSGRVFMLDNERNTDSTMVMRSMQRDEAPETFTGIDFFPKTKSEPVKKSEKGKTIPKAIPPSRKINTNSKITNKKI